MLQYQEIVLHLPSMTVGMLFSGEAYGLGTIEFETFSFFNQVIFLNCVTNWMIDKRNCLSAIRNAKVSELFIVVVPSLSKHLNIHIFSVHDNSTSFVWTWLQPWAATTLGKSCVDSSSCKMLTIVGSIINNAAVSSPEILIQVQFQTKYVPNNW